MINAKALLMITVSGRPVDVSTPETVQAVENLIRSDRRVILDEIAAKLDISHGTEYAIVREKLHFSKVSCRWVSNMLTDDHKMQRLMASRASRRRYRKEGDAFLLRIVTADETWVFNYEPESKQQSMEWKYASSPANKKFKSQKRLSILTAKKVQKSLSIVTRKKKISILTAPHFHQTIFSRPTIYGHTSQNRQSH